MDFRNGIFQAVDSYVNVSTRGQKLVGVNESAMTEEKENAKRSVGQLGDPLALPRSGAALGASVPIGIGSGVRLALRLGLLGLRRW